MFPKNSFLKPIVTYNIFALRMFLPWLKTVKNLFTAGLEGTVVLNKTKHLERTPNCLNVKVLGLIVSFLAERVAEALKVHKHDIFF